MDQTANLRWSSRKAVLVMALLGWPALAAAQLLGISLPSATTATTALNGQATAVRATVLGTTTTLADTGSLAGADDARNNSLLTGAVPGLLAGETLATTSIGWPDQVASAASLGNLALSVAGTGVSATLVMASAKAVLGAAGSGASTLDNLAINGVPVSVTGSPNQVIDIVGGRVVINEQASLPGGIVVNALHVLLDGVADVVVGSATAAIQ